MGDDAPREWGVYDLQRSRWLTHPGQIAEWQARRMVCILGPLRYEPRRQPPEPSADVPAGAASEGAP